MGVLRLDLTSAWKSLRRSPGFTAAAVLTLATGTGATLAIFTVVNAVLLAGLPYAAPERLVHVQGGEGGRYAVSMPLHALWAERAGTIEEAAAWQGWPASWRRNEGRLERRDGASVSWNWFTLLGQRPAAGRFFTADDGVAGHAPVVVLSHEFWRELEIAREGVVGGTLILDGEPHTVIGVAPASFFDPVAAHVLGMQRSGVAFWRADPPVFQQAATDGGWTGFWSVGRLRDGSTAAETRAEIAALMREAYPGWEDNGTWLQVHSFPEMATAHLRSTLLVLFTAAVLVLLVACANVANLLLSRATRRRHEIVVRSSLGASRLRLACQLFVENLLLATAAVALGLGLARLTTARLIESAQLGHDQPVAIDWRIALFAGTLAFATALVFGLAPALHAAEVRHSSVLRSSRGMRGAGGRTRAVLVACEVAVGVVVLVAAGLLGRTLWNLRAVDPGFDAAGAFVAHATLLTELFDGSAEQNATVEAMEREILAIPGVRAVGAITDLPLSGAVNSAAIVRPGSASLDSEESDNVLVRAVTTGYFDAMGIPLLMGRMIAATDREGGRPVAVINRSYSQRLPSGGIGQTVVVRGVSREIVGVVDDVVEFRLVEGRGDPVIYAPYAQEEQEWMRTGLYVVARAEGDPAGLAEPMRAAVERASPDIALSRRGRPLDAWIDADIAAHRFRATLLIVFAGISLVLAAAGIAAVTAYTVAQLLPEIGLRMALGATGGAVLRVVMGGAAQAVAAGLAGGLVLAYVASRVLAGYLYGLEARDPAVFAAAAALLSAVALLATWVPARRASTVDPVQSLRVE